MQLPYSLERDSELMNASMNLFLVTVLILYRQDCNWMNKLWVSGG